MIYTEENNKFDTIMEIINTQGFDGLSSAFQIVLNEAMKVERSQHLNASEYERTSDRTGYANGFKPKKMKSRIGQLNLNIPQVRDSDFYPSSLDKGMRSEKALRMALAEMYLKGVSTRKVEKITQKLCGVSFTSSDVSRATKLLDDEINQWRNRQLGSYKYVYFDARYEKKHDVGCIQDMAVLIAIGINHEGKREVLGISTSNSEAEVHWRDFFSSLISRGLHGVELIISDAHEGLKAARRKVFPSVAWQRCQFHLQQNAQSYVPKIEMRKEVAKDIRSVFDAPSEVEAKRLLGIAVEKYSKKAAKLSEWMEKNIPEGLSVFQFPDAHRKRIRTTNGLERVNREILRRTRVVSIFPNDDSCVRLVASILMEIHQDWATGKKYLNMDDQEI